MSSGERNLMGVVEYRGYTIKVVQHDDTVKLLIYAPDELIAQQIVVDRLSNHEEAMRLAKLKIDTRSIRWEPPRLQPLGNWRFPSRLSLTPRLRSKSSTRSLKVNNAAFG